MNYEKLEQLMSIPKKTDASKAKIEEYQTEMATLFAEEGFSQSAEKYLWKGFGFCGAKPLSIYMEKLSKEERIKVFESFIKNELFKKNEKGMAFRMLVGLLSSAVNNIPDDTEYFSLLVKWCMSKHKKKDGSIPNENIKTIEKYFVAAYDWQKISIPLHSLQINDAITREFCDYFLSVLNQINQKKLLTKINNIASWLQSGASTSEPIPAPPIPKSDDTEMKPEEDTSNLFTLAAHLKSLSSKLFTASEEQKADKKELIRLNEAFSELKKQHRITEEELFKKRNELDSASKIITEQKENIVELKAEIERLKAVISVYSEDKQSSMDGQLNAIASKLKSQYSELKDALDMEMTVEIGEILRDNLLQVFKILSKAGIDIESR